MLARSCLPLILFCWVLACKHDKPVAQNTVNPVTDNTAVASKITPVISPNGISEIVYRSLDAGLTWQDISYDLPTDIQASFLAEYSNGLLLATDNAGLFMHSWSDNQWIQIGDGLPGKKINALLVDQDTITVGVYRSGIFSSPDQGNSWNSTTFDLPDLRVQCILRYRGKEFVGTDTGVFQLDKAGRQWIQKYPGVQVVSLGHLQGHLVAGTNRGTLLSEDGGGSWRWIRQEGAVHYTRVVGEAIAEFCISGDLFFSGDLGTNWFQAEYTPSHASYVYAMTRIGNYLILSNNYGVHRSLDNGRHWQLIKPTETLGFFDLLTVDGVVYGATRHWDPATQRVISQYKRGQ